MNFQKTTLVIAAILLAIILIIVLYLVKNSKSKIVFPPYVDQCPDYWEVVDTNKCKNVNDIGNCSGTVDFSAQKYTGPSGIQEKAKWARGCGVTWDGITNV